MSYLQKSPFSYSILSPQNTSYLAPFSAPDLHSYQSTVWSTQYGMLHIKSSYEEQYQVKEPEQQDSSVLLLRPSSTPTQFIGMMDELIVEVQRVIKHISGTTLPYDLSVTLCHEEEFKEHYERCSKINRWHHGIRGFSMHSTPKQIFVLRDTLEKTLLTLGHEIGHIFSAPAVNAITEEAKAYAFEILFLEAAKILNCKNIGDRIDLSALGTPAANGIHNVAFQWINSFLMDGKSAKEIYDEIVRGDIVICED